MSFEPTPRLDRSANLDILRGLATFGMFYVSAVAYGLPHAAFFNLQSPGTNRWPDWVAAVVGEIFFDQKAVALMALLYGAGVVHLTSRVEAHGGKAGWIAMRRALIVFLLGVPVGLHGFVWEGTPLFMYGLLTPLLFLLRNRSVRAITAIGVFWIAFSTLMAFEFDPRTAEEASGLGQYWFTGSHELNDVAGGFMSLGTLSLTIGALVLGMAVGRADLLHADPSGRAVKRMIRYGLGFGLPLATASVVWRAVGDYQPDVAIVGESPNTVAAVPVALGYAGLVLRSKTSGWLSSFLHRVRFVGQMSLTNTAAQTVFGLFVLRDYGFGRGYFSRGGLVVVVLCVWAVQLVVSRWWLERFRYGPLEWIVRLVAYRQRLSLLPIADQRRQADEHGESVQLSPSESAGS